MKGVVILNIVIMWLVEYTVRVVIAVWIFISYPTNLAQLHMGIGILIWQIWNTLQAFTEGNTTFVISQQFDDVIEPPAIIICPKKLLMGWNL